MYYYIYDAFLTHKKYDKTMTKIEGRLTDLGIKNKIIKFNLLKNFKELVRDAIRAGAQNIVAVGNNNTLCQLANYVVGFNVTLGFIPMGKTNNTFAEYFGIPVGEGACEILSTRKTEMIDVGTINNQHFISCVETLSPHTSIQYNNEFSVSVVNTSVKIGIYNFNPYIQSAAKLFNPQDGILEMISWPSNKQTMVKINNLFKNNTMKQESLFRGNKFSIINGPKSKNVLIDGWRILKTPLEIGVKKQILKIIVGRDRKF